MIDENTDIASIEQVVVVFRWVDNALDAHEEFVGLHRTDPLEALTLVTIIKDTILRFHLKLELCRGQWCYDGASVMSDIKTGVAKQISDHPRAVVTHCYGALFKSRSGRFSKADTLFQKLKQGLAPDTAGFVLHVQ